MTATIAIDAAHAAIVRDILARHLPADVQAHVFGSRAAGAAKPYSDLDLVLEGNGPLPLTLMAELAEAFDESPLPWKVDVIDRATVSPEFGRIVDSLKVPFA
jgi:predicted nucleotidyltransferase